VGGGFHLLISGVSRDRHAGEESQFDYAALQLVYFCQLLYLIFDDVEGLFAKFLYNPLGHYRANALDKARAEVFLDAIDRRRNRSLVSYNLELFSVFGVIGPLAPHFQNFPRRRCHEVSHDGDEIPLSEHL